MTRETRCTGHCCRCFPLPYSPQQFADMLSDDIVDRCEDYEIIARMVIPLDNPDPERYPNDSFHWYTCKHLVDNNCVIYENRPKMCRDYPYGKKCEIEGCTYSGIGNP